MSNPSHHLLHIFSTFKVGGPQVRFAQTVNALGDGFRHTVLAMDGAYEAAKLVDPAVPLELLKEREVRGNPAARLLSMRRVLRSVRPDALVTYNWGAIEWGLAHWGMRLGHLHIEDGFGPEEAHQRLGRRNLFRRLALLGADRVIVPSRTLERIAGNEWGLRAPMLVYVPNGIDPNRFVAGAGKAYLETLGVRPDRPVLGTIAALRAEKNLVRLLDLIAGYDAVPQPQLVIFGDGPERERLQNHAALQGIADDVFFAGAVDRPEDVLGGLDLFVLTSDTEQMPYSVLEAMAARLAIVSTDVGDVREMVAPENRDFVVERNVPSLIAATKALLGNDRLRAQLGEANRARVMQEYGLERMIASYRRLFGGAA